MIRILTVDDEELILNTTCNYVEQHFDAEVFRAKSGFEALDLLRRMRFDVVITDVSMPLMDGIELMRNVKRVWPQCYVIILTVYDRFDYAYEATKFDQVDYVLKSDGTQALHSSLQKAIEWIEEEKRKEQMFSRLGQQLEILKPQMQAEAIQRILNKPEEMSSREEFRALGLEIDPERSVLLMLGALDAEHQSHTAIYLSGLSETLHRFLVGRGLRLQLVQMGSEILGLAQADGEIPDNEALVFIGDAFERCIESMEHNNGIRMAAAVGEGFVPWNEVPPVYNQLVYALEDLRNTAVLKVGVGSGFAPRRRYDCISPENIDLLWQYIRAENAAQFRSTLADLLAPLEEVSSIDALQPFAEAYALNYLYIKASRIMQPETDATSQLVSAAQPFGNTGMSGSEWVQSVLCAFDELFSRRIAVDASNASQLVARIDDYILTHYSEDIHLSTIAETFHYSPSYISRLYKEQTGKNLSGGINSVRINAARKLLLSTTLPVNEIGRRCGFYSNKYFMQSFKKATGQTPSQLRQKN